MIDVKNYATWGGVNLLHKNPIKRSIISAIHRGGKSAHTIFFLLGTQTSYAIYTDQGELLLSTVLPHYGIRDLAPLILDILKDVQPNRVVYKVRGEDDLNLPNTISTHFHFFGLIQAYYHLMHDLNTVGRVYYCAEDTPGLRTILDDHKVPESIREVIAYAEQWIKEEFLWKE